MPRTSDMPTPTTDVGHTALLDCPFCGGRAALFSRITNYWAYCTNESCGAEVGGEGTPEEAITAWNRRAHHEKLVEALRWYGERASSLASRLNGLAVADMSPKDFTYIEALLTEISLDAGRRAAALLAPLPSRNTL